MYDTLWIGCSHSAGLYDINNNIINSNAGIANRLAWGFDQKWKIITFPGEGSHTFMEAIKVLDDAGHLSKFRNIIVHHYDKVDHTIVISILRKNLNDFNKFKTAIIAYLKKMEETA